MWPGADPALTFPQCSRETKVCAQLQKHKKDQIAWEFPEEAECTQAGVIRDVLAGKWLLGWTWKGRGHAFKQKIEKGHF